MGNLHWMGKEGRWLCNQPGRECSALLSLVTVAAGTFLGGISLLLQEVQCTEKGSL